MDFHRNRSACAMIADAEKRERCAANDTMP
jgi:hypothetical protein